MLPPNVKGAKEAKAAKFVDKENLRRAEVEILTLQQLAEQRASEVRELNFDLRTDWSVLCKILVCAIEQKEACMVCEYSYCCLSKHQAIDARRSERNWRERVDAYGVAIEQQREDTLDITSDMLRQYKV